jgi:DNA repair exonuclease SbcCD ATPase subunit
VDFLGTVIMEDDLEKALEQKGRELQAALEELRTKEFSYKVNELKSGLPQQGRCVVCTLRIPCKHFSSVNEMPSLSPPTKENFSVYAYTKNLDISDIMPKLPKSEPKDFTIRFKGKETRFASSNQQRTSSLPNAEKLKLIEKIETYREEKIRKEIEMIQEMKEEEVRQKKNFYALEMARLKHAEKQKEKLFKYKEDLKVRNEVLKEQFEEDLKKRKKDEEKKKKYHENKKKELEQYYDKKKMMENISKQKVMDLEREVVNSVKTKINN